MADAACTRDDSTTRARGEDVLCRRGMFARKSAALLEHHDGIRLSVNLRPVASTVAMVTLLRFAGVRRCRSKTMSVERAGVVVKADGLTIGV
jgi:hypothetical protein